MCNPRRLEVNLSRQIEEELNATAEASATANVDVHERLERVIPLADRLGPSARLGLSAALADGFRDWQAVAGEDRRFTRELGPLHLSLDTDSAELVVAVERQASVSGEAGAEARYSARIRETVEVRETGTVYDDSPEHAVTAAEKKLKEKAESRMDSEHQRAIDEQSREVREDAERRAADEAQERAEDQAEALGEEERALLREELETLFQQSRSVLHEEVMALVGETLRRGVLHLVRVNGGELRRCEETDDAVVIEAVL